MSIAPFVPSPTGTGHKSTVTGKAAQNGQGGQDAGADSALGFLAQLAAAVGNVGPLGQVLALPTGLPGTGGDAADGRSTGAGTASATVDALTKTLTATLPTTLLAQLPEGTGQAAAATGQTVAGAGTATSLPTGAAATGATGLPTAVALAGLPTLPVAADLARTSTTPATDATAPVLPTTVPALQGLTAQGGGQGDTRTGAGSDDGTSGQSAAGDADPTAVLTATDPLLATLPAAQPAAIDSAAASIAAAAVAGTTATAATSTVTVDPEPQQTAAVLRQVFPEVTRVATSGQGTHRVAITLHPEDLGEVRVTVVVRAGTVHVDVATDPIHGIARAALEHGAPELRRLLEATGSDAQVRFREFGDGSQTGSATDGGRQQSQTYAQAQSQAQGDANGSGRSRSTYPSGDQSTQRDLPVASESDPSTPTARRLTSGVDQLI